MQIDCYRTKFRPIAKPKRIGLVPWVLDAYSKRTLSYLLWLPVLVVGVAMIVWGAETFAEHLGKASARLGVGAFALALLLAGAEPEELATVVAASLRHAPGIAFGDIIGSNVAMCLVALGLGASMAPLRFTKRVLLYELAAVPVSVLSVAMIWDGQLSRLEGAILIGLTLCMWRGSGYLSVHLLNLERLRN